MTVINTLAKCYNRKCEKWVECKTIVPIEERIWVKNNCREYFNVLRCRRYNRYKLTGIIIENDEIVKTLKTLFDLAWDNLKKKSS